MKKLRSPFVVVPMWFIPPIWLIVCFRRGWISVWAAVPLARFLERFWIVAQASYGSGGWMILFWIVFAVILTADGFGI